VQELIEMAKKELEKKQEKMRRSSGMPRNILIAFPAKIIHFPPK
jgi:hypothetical protein